jgi:rhamnose transport system substrate-binding protein
MASKAIRALIIGAATAAALLPAWLLSPKAQADDFQLAMVIKSSTNPYYKATLAGAEIAAKEIGGSVRNYGPTESSAQAQVDIINNLADRHIPAIAVAPSDPDAVVPAMKRAERLGAKVLTFDADSSGGRPFFVNQATSDAIGRFGAVLLIKSLGPNPQGQVAIVSAQPTAANQNLWIAAFKDEISKYKGLTVVDTVYGYDNEQKAFDATVALTTKYPHLAGIFAPTCPGLPAVARALESVNKGHGAIKVSGNCVPSITAKYMLDGTIDGFYLWNPIKLGYVTYYAAKALVDGKIQGKPGESITITQGKWPGKYVIGANGQIVTGEPVQFTAENYKDFNF